MVRVTRRLSLLVGLLICVAAPPLFAQVAPSANKEKPGTYSVDTDVDNYKYFVCVPKAYDGKRPAGIHLYFHGQNGQTGANNFGNWSKYFLEPYDLIGINMQYNDGDNYKDTDNKVRVARQAVLQVLADYKTLPRGVVASFSGGGQTLGTFFSKHGKPANPRDAFWPFQHFSIYGSNFRVTATGGPPMTWFIGLGGKEWNKFTIGQSQTARAAELFADTARGGCPDVYLRIEPAKDHAISTADVAASAAMYARGSVAFTPFVSAADFPERELQQSVVNCNQLALGRAETALHALLMNANAKAEIKEKAQSLKTLLDERVDAVLKLSKQLSTDDPVLFAWYSALFAKQLAGHPRLKELTDIVAIVNKDAKAQRAALADWANFVRGFPNVFSDKPGLKPGAAESLEQVKAAVPPQSVLGTMATEFLQLK